MEQLGDADVEIEFFQFVRSLERQLWAADAAQLEASVEGGLGEWEAYADEPIRFRAANLLSCPDRAVVAARSDSADSARPPWLVDVSFMGLVGQMGVLPNHVTSWLLGEGEAARPALRDFLSLFEHRFIARFYRAWEQAHFGHGFERAVRQNHTDSAHGSTYAIRALTGFADPAICQKLQVSDRLPAFYAGLISNLVRPAENLAQIICAAFDVPCGLVEFIAEWQAIPLEQQSRLGGDQSGSRHDRWNNCLGSTACAGKRVWTVQDRFRVQLGPLDFPTFSRFLPAGDLFAQLREVIRLYAGTELAFDIQPILLPDEVPSSQLGHRLDGATQLGWNSWLGICPRSSPATDAVFCGSA